MKTIQEARSVLADAEKSLRDLMQRELQAQRYSDLPELAGMADGLAKLASRTMSAHTEPTLEMSAQSSNTPKVAQTSPSSRKSRPKRRASKADYPRFERDDDKLVKVGWSKKHRKEYEHRAPRDAVEAFARYLCGSVHEGHVFVVEELLPVPDLNSEDDVPTYQIYLALKWLQDIGAVEKKGRDGYVLRNNGLSDGVIEEFWAELPKRKV